MLKVTCHNSAAGNEQQAAACRPPRPPIYFSYRLFDWHFLIGWCSTELDEKVDGIRGFLNMLNNIWLARRHCCTCASAAVSYVRSVSHMLHLERIFCDLERICHDLERAWTTTLKSCITSMQAGTPSSTLATCIARQACRVKCPSPSSSIRQPRRGGAIAGGYAALGQSICSRRRPGVVRASYGRRTGTRRWAGRAQGRWNG